MDTRQYFRARGVAATFPQTSLVRRLVGGDGGCLCRRHCCLRRPDRSRDRCRRHGSTNAKGADTAAQKTFDSKCSLFLATCMCFGNEAMYWLDAFSDGSPGSASVLVVIINNPSVRARARDIQAVLFACFRAFIGKVN